MEVINGMRRRLKLLVLAISAILPVTCTCSCAPPAPKITLADAPILLDLSPLLPANFQHFGVTSENLSSRSMFWGTAEISAIELFRSFDPYQMIYVALIITDSGVERLVANTDLKDAQRMEVLIMDALKGVAASAGYGLHESEIEITISYPNIADFAVLREGRFSASGLTSGLDVLGFSSNGAYVYLYSPNIPSNKQPLVPLAKEIAQRISTFSH